MIAKKQPYISSPSDEVDFQAFSQALIRDEKGFELLSQLLRELTGVNLPNNPKNLTMMAGRLSPILMHLNIKTY